MALFDRILNYTFGFVLNLNYSLIKATCEIAVTVANHFTDIKIRLKLNNCFGSLIGVSFAVVNANAHKTLTYPKRNVARKIMKLSITV